MNMKKKYKILCTVSVVLITLLLILYIIYFNDNSGQIKNNYTSKEVIEIMGNPSLKVIDENDENIETYVYWNQSYRININVSFPFIHLASKRVDVVLNHDKVEDKYETWFSGKQ